MCGRPTPRCEIGQHATLLDAIAAPFALERRDARGARCASDEMAQRAEFAGQGDVPIRDRTPDRGGIVEHQRRLRETILRNQIDDPVRGRGLAIRQRVRVGMDEDAVHAGDRDARGHEQEDGAGDLNVHEGRANAFHTSPIPEMSSGRRTTPFDHYSTWGNRGSY